MKYAMADGSAEFADSKYTEVVRRNDIMFTNGNIEGWAKMFANNVVMVYANGDSIVGKKAIIDFWTNRRNTLVESVGHQNNVFLPVRIVKSQGGFDLPGVWLLQWTEYTTKYKSGQTVRGLIHADFHFNEDDLVDRVLMYQDMAPTMEVTGEKRVPPTM